MSSTAQNTIEIDNIKTELAKSKKLSELTGQERQQIEDAIHPEITTGFRAWKKKGNFDYTAWQNGDQVFEVAGDNLFYLGKIIDANGFDPSNVAHLNDISKFDRYLKQAKAII